jgi:beta-N-acetylhexosaminidase
MKHWIFGWLATASVAVSTSFWNPFPGSGDRAERRWVDSVMATLDESQRLGQLFMLAGYPDKGQTHEDELAALVRRYQIGGVIFFKSDPTPLAKMVNRLQSESKIPLLTAIDGEWGIGMRVDSVPDFPRQLMLGAIRDNQLIYEMGQAIARQCKRVGVCVNFAPVVDVNNNPNNPVINDRSFGEDRSNVSAKGFQYMSGLQEGGVMACAKHFPGHGDTDKDSHFDLPVIQRDIARLDTVELFPFVALAQHGLQSVMTTHLSIPALDTTHNLPSTLSPKIVHDLLTRKIGFRGLIFTDALGMKGVSKFFRPGQSELRALLAGNDVLLMPENIAAAFDTIRAALSRGEISQASIDARARKILGAKYRLGLPRVQPVTLANLRQDLNGQDVFALRERLIEAALTLARNRHEVLPVRRTDSLKIACISLGTAGRTAFQAQCAYFSPLLEKTLLSEIPTKAADQTLAEVKDCDLVIVGVHGMSRKAEANFGVTASEQAFLERLQAQNRTALCVFGNPYSLRLLDYGDAVVMAYEDNETVQRICAQAIFGSASLSGRLPVTASAGFPFGAGENRPAFRLPYGDAAREGLKAWKLDAIDAVARELIAEKAAPGCQVLVAKNGKIVFHRTYGNHTYEKNAPSTSPSDLYDLASITKIAATTLAVMKLHDEGRIDLNQTLGHYLPELEGTNKAPLVLREVLVHQAGLKDWIPFYQTTLDKNKKPKTELYKGFCDSIFCVPVSEKLFLKKSFPDSIWNSIFRSELRASKDYVYSDLGLYLTQRVVEKITGKPLDQYVNETFYLPMGLRQTLFNPRKKLSPERMVPTELDAYFRYQTVQGTVHDMGSAMMGGVAGHAGLFSTAPELATLMQLLLNNGEWAGVQYLSPQTIRLFTAYHDPQKSRRGIGFDKPEPDPQRTANTAQACSPGTFGHTGFTGTCVWADPAHQLVYVFLSNRTYPNMDNRKLITGNYRTRIQNIVYEALAK